MRKLWLFVLASFLLAACVAVLVWLPTLEGPVTAVATVSAAAVALVAAVDARKHAAISAETARTARMAMAAHAPMRVWVYPVDGPDGAVLLKFKLESGAATDFEFSWVDTRGRQHDVALAAGTSFELTGAGGAWKEGATGDPHGRFAHFAVQEITVNCTESRFGGRWSGTVSLDASGMTVYYQPGWPIDLDLVGIEERRRG